ncbi:cell division protein ZipA C-terminal FtsZ-binding domain-containing protein [Clostridium sp. MB05]|uniref:cell division protein ZipA C-terminal FtsZ-binding domain-containing protein n=1 Tax=Clostridium sp. MB05 TaxID=3376682 RepID=UPI003982740C
MVVTWKSRESQGVLGKEIETLMKELNLEWRDMDLYHLPNTCTNGDDVLFSVATNTNLGYFMPNQMNEFKYKDLVFVMNISRTYKPIEVFEIMWNGILYIQEKIGGTIVNEKNEEISKEFYIKEIRETVKRFNKYGQEPGEDAALFLF